MAFQRANTKMAVRSQGSPMPSDALPKVTNSDRNLAIFATLKRKYAAQQNIIITPGYIRIEQKITNGKSRYIFTYTKDSNSDTVTEVKLDRNDQFIATHTGLFLMKRDSTIPGIEVLQTYPNPVEIPDDSTNFYCKHLEAFYNGSFGVQVGQTVYIEKMDTARFRFVGENIQTSSIVKSSFGEFTGFSELTPQIEFSGDGKSIIAVDAPIDATAKVANTVSNMSNYLVLIFRGFLVTRR